ncbi:MAG: hypothetical protein RI883_2369 [Bacteroidota bacterium]|jgi:hypothetical protein
MKLLVLLFLFQFQLCFSQKDSILFRNSINIEFNIGPGLLKYKEKEYSNNSSFYQAYKELSLNFSMNIFYRYKRFNTGIQFQSMYFPDYLLNSISLNCGFNILSKSNSNFFGPTVGYGFVINRIWKDFPQYSLGLDYRHKHLHVGIKNSWFRTNDHFSNLINLRNLQIDLGIILYIK